MRGKIVSFLQRHPTLLKIASSIHQKFSYLKERLLGTSVKEREWATRHLRGGDDWCNSNIPGDPDEWVKGEWDSREHGHRRLLVETIARYEGISGILEVGANCGPNLYLLSKRLPKAELVGVDINQFVVDKGNEFFAKEGITNVKLLCQKADDLGNFKDKSFDVVFTDAVLIYIGPDKIAKVMKDMVRLARKAIVFVEYHSFDGDPNWQGVYYHGKWKRNYVEMFKKFVPSGQVRVTKITYDIWPDQRWSEVGAVVECLMEKGVGES